MAGNYLIPSRHGTLLYFRRRVPDDLRTIIGKHYLVRSLGTGRRREAIILARAYAAQTDTLFQNLRSMSKTKKTSPARVELKLFMTFHENGTLKSYDADAEGPEEAAQAQAALEAALQGGLGKKGDAGKAQASNTTTISDAWHRYKAEKIAAQAWRDGEDTAKNDHFPHVRCMLEVIGDMAITDVTADDINRFQNHVLHDPNGGAPRNRKKRLERAGAIFKWAKSKRIIDDDFRELFRYPGKIEQNTYHAFDLNDLKALFESAEYREHRFRTPSEYWLPLLALHTGARLNELCQLDASDIGEREGVATIAILDDDANKRLKTAASRRIVPIHSTLIDCGFLDYASSIKAGRLFPELPENTARRGDYTKEASRKFTSYRRSKGVGSPTGKSNKAFHSFRATLISALRKANVPGDRRRRLAGHDAGDVHDKNYTGGDILGMFDFATLKADIERARFNVEFAHYKPYSAKSAPT